MPIIIAYVATVVALVLLDFVWVGILFKNFYQHGLSAYLAKSFNLWAAGLLYVIYAIGIYYFAIHSSNSLLEACGRGAFLGFVAYSLYDLTNIATFTSWPIGLGVFDVFWGTVLSGAAASIGYLVLQFFSK